MVGYWEGSLRELSLRIVIVRLNLDFSHGDKKKLGHIAAINEREDG